MTFVKLLPLFQFYEQMHQVTSDLGSVFIFMYLMYRIHNRFVPHTGCLRTLEQRKDRGKQ